MAVPFQNAPKTRLATSPSDRWVDLYGDYLFRFALSRLHDTAAAEDAVQDTLLAAISSQQRFSNASTERTWLTAILKHKIADHYRSIFSKAFLVDSTLLDETDALFFDSNGHWKTGFRNTPSHEFDRREFVRSLRSALAGIPKRLAVVFTLREIEGMGTREICELLGISSENLFVMLHRARLHLREALARTACART